LVNSGCNAARSSGVIRRKPPVVSMFPIGDRNAARSSGPASLSLPAAMSRAICSFVCPAAFGEALAVNRGWLVGATEYVCICAPSDKRHVRQFRDALGTDAPARTEVALAVSAAQGIASDVVMP